MTIRLAEASHIPGLIRLLYQVGDVHHRIRPDIFRPGALKYTQEDLEVLLADPSRPVFVAEEGETVLGYCFCKLRSYAGDGACTDRMELYIDDLCVEESCRGQHIGTALYDHACGYAGTIGCQFLTLNVWCGNDSAMKFYEHAGLAPRSIMMEKKLC